MKNDITEQSIKLTKAGFKVNRVILQKLIILGILVLIIAVLSILSDKFLNYTNILNVLRQSALVIISGSAVTLLMISGNFDLSIGSILALTGVLSAKFVVSGIPLWLSIILAVFTGTLIGAVNGVLVSNLQIPSIIATLGMMYAARGFAFIVCGGNAIVTGLPKNFDFIGRGFIGPIPILLLITFIIFLIFYFIESRTILGLYSFAIGGNRDAAMLSGINTKSHIVLLFILVGTLTGFSGALMASRLGVGSPVVGDGFEFDVIVAVLLGGTSLYGGEGSVIGMLIGALIVGFLRNGLNLLGIQTFYQSVLMGGVLVGAVLLDGTLKRKLK